MSSPQFDPRRRVRESKAHSDCSPERLSFAVVKDMGAKDAFRDVVVASPPFDAVVHTASPFHFNTDNPKRDLLEPAIRGTVELLGAIKVNAPSVKKVVLTSSFAAVLNFNSHPKVYTEANWNPVTWEEAEKSASAGYPGSKTFAEKAAWDSIEKEKPNFTLTAMNPPLIFGPVVHYLNDLSTINTSNTMFRDIIEGKMTQKLPPTSGFPDWVDVREVAEAHVRAMERSEASGKRFILSAGKYSNADIARVIVDNFPDIRERLPASYQDDLPADTYAVDNTQSKKVLGMSYRSLEESVKDTVRSLLDVFQRK